MNILKAFQTRNRTQVRILLQDNLLLILKAFFTKLQWYEFFETVGAVVGKEVIREFNFLHVYFGLL